MNEFQIMAQNRGSIRGISPGRLAPRFHKDHRDPWCGMDQVPPGRPLGWELNARLVQRGLAAVGAHLHCSQEKAAEVLARRMAGVQPGAILNDWGLRGGPDPRTMARFIAAVEAVERPFLEKGEAA